MPPLTDQQEKILFLLPIFPSLLSLACSVTILYIVYLNYKRNKRRHYDSRTTVYHRLLVGMSLCDGFVSFWTPWSAFFLPAQTSNRIWAIGTPATCTFMGFMQSFIVIGMMYNASLSYYFVLTARYGWRDADIAKWIEPLIHIVVAVFPITCGLVYAVLGVYGEQYIGPSCWVDDYPPGCADTGTCITPMLGWIAAGLPVMLSFVSLFINNALIYCHVRKTIQKVRRYSAAPFNNNSSSHNNNHRSSLMSNNFSSIMLSRLSSIQSLVHNNPQQQQQQNHRDSLTMRPPRDSHTRRLQSVASQAGLYLLVFLLNYIWTIILKNLGAQPRYWSYDNESELFWLLCLQSIFLPLQGFFNLAVFSRPKFLATRKKFPNHTFWCVFKRAMFGTGQAPPANTSGLVVVSGGGGGGGISASARAGGSVRRASARAATAPPPTNMNNSKFLVAIEQGNEEEEDAFHEEEVVEDSSNNRPRKRISFSKRIDCSTTTTSYGGNEHETKQAEVEDEQEEPSFSHDEILAEAFAPQAQPPLSSSTSKNNRHLRWGFASGSSSLGLSFLRQSSTDTTNNNNNTQSITKFWSSVTSGSARNNTGAAAGLVSLDPASLNSVVRTMDRQRSIKMEHFHDAFLFGFDEEDEDEESSLYNLHDQDQVEEALQQQPSLDLSLNQEEELVNVGAMEADADDNRYSNNNNNNNQDRHHHHQQQVETDHSTTIMIASDGGGDNNNAALSDHYCNSKNDDMVYDT